MCIFLLIGRSYLGYKILCFVCKGYESKCIKVIMKVDCYRYLKDC